MTSADATQANGALTNGYPHNESGIKMKKMANSNQ
jgi:hypothetical protein